MSSEKHPPPIDRDTLAALERLQRPGQPSFKAKMIGVFVRDSHRRMAMFRVAHDADDTATLKGQAHSFKSSTAILGARHLASLCLELERSAESADREVRGALVSALLAEVERVVEALKSEPD